MSIVKNVVFGLFVIGLLFAGTASEIVPDISGYTTTFLTSFGSEDKSYYGSADGFDKCDIKSGAIAQKDNKNKGVVVAAIVIQCKEKNGEIKNDILTALDKKATSNRKSEIMEWTTVYYYDEEKLGSMSYYGSSYKYASFYYFNVGDTHVEIGCADQKNSDGTECRAAVREFVKKAKEKANDQIFCCPSLFVLLFGLVGAVVYSNDRRFGHNCT
jgi:hypothetical protein